jgi:hypothetical protein
MTDTVHGYYVHGYYFLEGGRERPSHGLTGRPWQG